MSPTLIKQSPKLYVVTLLEYLDPLDTVLCLLVSTSHVIMSISDVIQLRNSFDVHIR